MTAAAIVAIVAAVVAAAAAGAAFVAASRARSRTRTLELEIERGRARFDEVVHRESELLAAQLEQSVALARSQAISALADEERRITDERRRDVAERERDATAKLMVSLTAVQRAVEQRFADWASDVTALQQGLSNELERIGQRQQQLIAGLEARLEAEAERQESALEEQRNRLVRFREEIDRAAQEVATAFTAELEAHAAERRRALQEVADRLARRERDLTEQIEREQAESAQRVSSQLEDVERRQVEQVRRTVIRESQQLTEGAASQFDGQIRVAREDAAKRLGRELDIAVERFVRQAEGVLAERVDAELRIFESRLQEIARQLESLSARG
jgi:hypothetical protein